MGLFQPSNRQNFQPPHAHAAGERCPMCEQPIGQDIAHRIEARQREQYEATLAKAQAEMAGTLKQKLAEAAAANEHKIAAVRAEMKAAAEAAAAQKLADVQARLAHAEQARTAAGQEIAALKADQQAAVEKRVTEAVEGLQRKAEDLQREKDAAVLAERTRAFEDQQRLQAKLQDMQRQLEKKSAHELGEGSEVDLYEQLKAAFAGDRISRVGKGVNGADVIHEVIHNGKVCGKIVYDAKNRNAWQNEFVVKLRADKIAQAADHAILSSNKFPKDSAQVHYQDGVIVALPARVVAIVHMLRDQVVRMHELRVSKEGREQKSMALYAFITSEHCRQLIEQVEAQAGKMIELDTREQEAHRRLWDARRKLINAVQKARSDLGFEIDRIVGTAGNGPGEDEEAA
jgi:hypothetical protein